MMHPFIRNLKSFYNTAPCLRLAFGKKSKISDCTIIAIENALIKRIKTGESGLCKIFHCTADNTQNDAIIDILAKPIQQMFNEKNDR